MAFSLDEILQDVIEKKKKEIANDFLSGKISKEQAEIEVSKLNETVEQRNEVRNIDSENLKVAAASGFQC